MVHAKIHHLPSPFGDSLHIDACGKAVGPMRKPESITRLGADAMARMLSIGAVSSGKISTRMYPFAEQIIGRDPHRTRFDILNQPVAA